MNDIIEMLLLFPLITILYQFYRFSVQRKDADKQKKCQTLGIVYCTMGIFALVFRSPFFIFGGLLLIMFGFRLLAHGLDRINKTTFIDQYEEDK
jgi:multisubunit Na+/H+ antiporter MnhG subunit